MRRRRLPRIFLSFLVVFAAVLVLTIGAFLRIRMSLGFESRIFKYDLPEAEQRHGASRNVHYADRPWFLTGGLLRPKDPKTSRGESPRLWPHEDPGDRIVEQLMYVPPGYDVYRNSSAVPLKKILLYFGRSGWSDLPTGRNVFLRDKCPVDTCTISMDHADAPAADLILFKDRFSHPKHKRSSKQVWLLFLLECPQHTQSFTHLSGIFNWTATYRHDSDIVAPYEKFVSYERVQEEGDDYPPRDYAAGKSRKVAWFVSNCAARNKRLQYARALGKHIQVDIYGKCGKHRCPRSRANRCFQLLDKDYKFYLAFENSNCKDYITEKFFVNGLGHDVIPIAMGARPEDYERSAPPNSYLHVEDFEDVQAMAGYLHLLDSNSTLYNSYFRWKSSGEFINTRFWCRLCALLHAPTVPKVYTDLQAWWAAKGTCVKDEWRKGAL